MRYLLCFAVLFASVTNAQVVRNAAELSKANETAKPGDTIILQNGQWNNISIRLTCSGTPEKPILFKAQTPGKVLISGVSDLKLGGNYIIVDGLLFAKGYSPSKAVIDFEETANHCRVTNCVIDDFNKPKRLLHDEWITFSGKHNRLDHCLLQNKKNMGTLLAVLLDDDRSRENFHSIDHNHFGIRPPLASNGGEIIRIGLAQHCQFNSKSLVKDNLFEYCDGEAEVISIKSGGNIITGNTFKECQGSVVLRHGDNNTVINNQFLGYGKEATGGVRIINKGQWVINNYFYRLRGEGFRAPLSIMNGVPNSPPTRYVQVTDAVIMNNRFVDCAPASICEGSDKERSLPPDHVLFANNDSLKYQAWDDISGICFAATISIDSLKQIGAMRLATDVKQDKANGVAWYKPAKPVSKPRTIDCKTAADIYRQLKNTPLTIHLTGSSYTFDKPLVIAGNVEITGNNVTFVSAKELPALFIVKGHLALNNLQIAATKLNTNSFIDTDTSGRPEHYSVVMNKVSIANFHGTILNAQEATLADSIIVKQCRFNDTRNGFLLAAEKTNKGYYNVEKIQFIDNQFTNGQGTLLHLLRGGTDESTLGPKLFFNNNQVSNYSGDNPLVILTGVQRSIITGNRFNNCNPGRPLMVYKDIIRATHYLAQNSFINSGPVATNNYVTGEDK